MILCSYTLDLTCDSAHHHPFEEATTAAYTARTRQACLDQARMIGWKLWRGKAICPRCAPLGKFSAEKVTDAAVLAMLRASHAPIIAADLARLCNVGPPTMTRTLQRLEQEGKIRKIRKTRTSHWLEAV
jgi:hypothetical protein